MNLIGLALPVTLWLGIRSAVGGAWSEAAVLLVVSVPLLVLDVWVWRRILFGRPAIVLTEDALLDQASLFGAGRIERHEIASVGVEQHSFWKMVTVQRRGPNGKRLRPAMMPGVLLADPPDSVAAEIRAWHLGAPRY